MNPTILFAGAWDEGPGYPRARALRTALEAVGCTVLRCRIEPPWGADKRVLLRSPWRWPRALLGTAKARRRLARSCARAVADRGPAAVLVPYPGHSLVAAIAAAVPVPVVLDLFLSAHDTAVFDRRICRSWGPTARLLKLLDRRACRAADTVLLDTPEHAQYVAELTGLPGSRFDYVPVSDPDAPDRPAPYRPPQPGAALDVLFFGTGVPLHGLDVLLDAVGGCDRVVLTVVGGSPADRDRAARLPGDRLRLLPAFIDRSALQREIDRSHLVAGVFSTSPKAARVVPFKVVHALASGRPVISADTPPLRRWLPGAVERVAAGDAEGLRAALVDLAGDPSRLVDLAAAARPAYDRTFAPEPCGHRLLRILGCAETERVPEQEPAEV